MLSITSASWDCMTDSTVNKSVTSDYNSVTSGCSWETSGYSSVTLESTSVTSGCNLD